MFLENAQQNGWIEVIVGLMFSVKTEELIRQMQCVQFSNQKIEAFNFKIDTRYLRNHMVSHDFDLIHSISVDSLGGILLYLSSVESCGG